MRILDGSARLDAALRGGVIALGNFDGFHLGHQSVIGRTVAMARADGVPALVGTFDPHPARYFRPENPPFQLTTIDQRARLFAGAGVDGTVAFHFGDGLADASPEQFVADWLVERLGATGVVTGGDFTFGKGRSGDFAMLARLGATFGLRVEHVAPVMDGTDVVSSSHIREALRAADVETAARLLTRPYTIEGVVEHGDKRGRVLGFPTANIALGDYQRPAYGVYAVRCRLADGRMVIGAANIGVRPMFDPPRELLEVHIIDFAGDLYGQPVAVELHHYLRPEARFDGLEALVAQMTADCARAKELLAG